MAEGKWISGLSPEMPVAEAANLILATRFEVVRRYLPLAVEQPYQDTEHVHQLRVGTRRAGAALRVFRDCFPRSPWKETRRHLRAIRRAAGDARDWDVFRLGLRESEPLSDSAARPALDFLTGYAMGERDAAQTRLVEAATGSGPAFTELSAELPGLAREPRVENPPGLFGTLAGIQFGDLLGTFDAAVRANPTEPAALHQLRILGKRVRYALELFAPCFPPALTDAVYPAVEEAQEVLGEIQDAVVGSERLSELRDRMMLAAPEEWERVEKGIEGMIEAMREKIPDGLKAFQRWRGTWDDTVRSAKSETGVGAG